ncbi:hypothetical protein OFC46_27415, partial [Escherichia coli]|nr:hypothetical protein [Escherichia coli]
QNNKNKKNTQKHQTHTHKNTNITFEPQWLTWLTAKKKAIERAEEELKCPPVFGCLLWNGRNGDHQRGSVMECRGEAPEATERGTE